jgi:O-antigen biosynthesis protein
VNKFIFLVKVSIGYWKRNGLISLLNKVRKNIFSLNALYQMDVSRTYDFIDQKSVGVLWSEELCEENVVNWVIPNFGIGSGGHLNIFRFISFLENANYKINIIIDEPDVGQNVAAIKEKICDNFIKLKANIYIGIDNAPPAYATFATSWSSAYSVKAFNSTKKKFYFIQDYEPNFYALGSEYIWAENTYKFGFTGITAGKWLTDKLSSEFGMQCDHVGFSYEKDRYTAIDQSEKQVRSKTRIFFYARPPTPRRALELGIMALKDVCNKRNNVEVVFAGWNMDAYKFDFDYESHGVVSLDQLSQLYNSCDMALVLSLTNLSLLPLELMASGVPVISNKGPNVEWLLNENICVFSESSIEGISEAIIQLIDDEERRISLRNKALDFVKTTSWEFEGKKFVDIFQGFLKDK